MPVCRTYLTAIVAVFISVSQFAHAQITTDSDAKSYSSSTERVSAKGRLALIRDVAKDASRLLEGESLAATPTDKLDYALKLVKSLDELRRDPRLQRSAHLKRTQQQLVSRLKAISYRTSRDHRRRKQKKTTAEKPAKIEIRQDVLAQLNAAAAGVNGVNAGVNVQNANGGNQGNQDYGPMLVDLIQRTISPGSWDVNGGLSSIQYWAPRRVLVVRAPQDVHDGLAPVLQQLRKQ